MSDRPSFTIEYLEPVEIEAEPLPDEFSSSRLKRSLLILGAIVAVVVAVIVLVPGLSSLRERFAGAQPEWLLFAAVLQLCSCASYVLVFRAVFCQRMSWRTSSEIGLSELAANSVFSIGGAGGLALGAWILRRGGLPASYIARRTVAFFLLTSLANVGFLALGGTLLAIGVLHGASMPLLGIIPAVAGAARRSRSRSACARSRGVLARRWMKERLVATAEAVGDGVDEALRLLRTGNPAIYVGAAGYMLFDVAMLGVCFTAFGTRGPARRRAARRLPDRAARQPDPDPRRHRRRRRRADRHARALRRRRGRRRRRGDRLPRAAAGDPGALGLPALAVLRKRLQSEQHDIAACAPGQSVEVLGRGMVERAVPVTTA